MRRPRCGTCRHWINDEGGVPYCKRFPPTALDNNNSSHPVVPHWAGCAEHKYHTRRLLTTMWSRLLGGQGNRPPLAKPAPRLTHDNRSVS